MDSEDRQIFTESMQLGFPLSPAESDILNQGRAICVRDHSDFSSGNIKGWRSGTIHNALSLLVRLGALIRTKRDRYQYYWVRGIPFPNTGWARRLGKERNVENQHQGVKLTRLGTSAPDACSQQNISVETPDPRITLGMTGVMSLRPKLHFLEAVAESRGDVFTHQELRLNVGPVSVEVTFGQQRRRIDLRISQNRPGLSLDQYEHVMGEAWKLIEQKLGRTVAENEFKVANLHLSLDLLQLRLDGAKSITVSDLTGWMCRLY